VIAACWISLSGTGHSPPFGSATPGRTRRPTAGEGRSQVGRSEASGDHGAHRLSQGAVEVDLIWIISGPHEWRGRVAVGLGPVLELEAREARGEVVEDPAATRLTLWRAALQLNVVREDPSTCQEATVRTVSGVPNPCSGRSCARGGVSRGGGSSSCSTTAATARRAATECGGTLCSLKARLRTRTVARADHVVRELRLRSRVWPAQAGAVLGRARGTTVADPGPWPRPVPGAAPWL
jgi:hypothetical protein